ncbi:MAG TPA: peptide chain release factor N(5)-glutamine methyltransferase, partial [Paracoccaceae bacterium]|nr:peptide chain release factor N(5)-glutamine methyltransferase [Paracoccaceae bacterium]
MTVSEALALAVARLTEVGIEGAPRDARRLMAAALGLAPDRVTLHLRDSLEEGPEAAFFALVESRARRSPIAHILGGREFFGRWFEVTADVLDPRPETESLVVAALEQPFERVLDLGTGSGAILLSLLAERPEATGMGTDISPAALRIAALNTRKLGLDTRTTLIESDWLSAVTGQFDLIVSNPPYIARAEMADLAPELKHEPRQALTDEGDGLSAYRAIAAGAVAHLRDNGRVMVEIGWQQGDAVSGIFRQAGFDGVHVLPDMDGRD